MEKLTNGNSLTKNVVIENMATKTYGDHKPSYENLSCKVLATKLLQQLKDNSIAIRFKTIKIASILITCKLSPSSSR
jgi:hypothetical protein